MPTYNQPQSYLTMYTVRGLDGVNSFPVRPGDRVLLIDSEEAVIYVKTANALGQILPLETYDLVLRKTVSSDGAMQQVSHKELEDEVNKYVKEALKRYFPQINIED